MKMFSKTCLLSENSYKSFEFVEGEIVEVVTPDFSVLSAVLVDHEQDDGFAQLTSNVYKNSSHVAECVIQESLVLLESCQIKKINMAKSQISSIDILVYASNSFRTTRNISFDEQQLKADCKLLLEGEIIGKGFYCDFRGSIASELSGIDAVLICHSSNENSCGFIGMTSTINIINVLHDSEVMLNVTNLNSFHERRQELKNIERFLGSKEDRIISFLLWGPQGCEKCSLINALAKKTNSHVLNVSLSMMMFSPRTFDSQILLFLKEALMITKKQNCFILFHDIDVLEKESTESKVVTSYLKKILKMKREVFNNRLFMFLSTESKLNTTIRCTREVFIAMPSKQERLKFFTDFFKDVEKLEFSNDQSLTELPDTLASKTAGYNWSEIGQIMEEGIKNASVRIKSGQDKQSPPLPLSEDFPLLASGGGSSKIHGEDHVTVDEPGQFEGYEEIKNKIMQSILRPPEFPEAYKKLALKPDRCILLHGRPGCGKTSLVRMIANISKMNFFFLSSAQLYSPYLGDSEKKLSTIFLQALACSPSIIFIDEIDSVIGSRSAHTSGSVQDRVLTVLLNLLDGIGEKVNDLKKSTDNRDDNRVILIAASNRINLLDPALMRRYDLIIEVPSPSFEARRKILKHYTAKFPSKNGLDLDRIAQETENFTGADLENLCKKAMFWSVREYGHSQKLYIENDHFKKAIAEITVS